MNRTPLTLPSPRRWLIGWLLGFLSLCSLAAVVPVQAAQPGIDWTAQTAAANQPWNTVTYGNGLFVAMSYPSTSTKPWGVMTSPNGINWTLQANGAGTKWTGVAYGNGRFVAVSQGDKTAGSGKVLTSTDGITWTEIALKTTTVAWTSVTYGKDRFGQDRFVAVSQSGGTEVMTMTSTDGTNWTLSALVSPLSDCNWRGVTYGNGQFVAVASGPGTSTGCTGQRVMTSPDGSNWTVAQPSVADNTWRSVTYGNGLFVAVACGVANNTNACNLTAGNRVMTSPDGITWTPRTAAAENNWVAVTYGNGLFVAVSTSGTNRVMTSPDGSTWTPRTAAAASGWVAVTYGNGLFVAVSSGSNGVMISGNLCGAGLPLTTTPTALWQPLALPCVPATTTTGTTLGANTTGQLEAALYGNAGAGGWLMYGNDLLNDRNLRLGVDDTLTNGGGYWLKSFSAPVGGGNLSVTGTATPAPVTTTDGCASANGCAAVTVATVAGADRYNLVGNPFPYNVDWAKVRVRVKNIGGSVIGTYTPSQSAGVAASGNANPPVMSNQIWLYNGTSYGTWTDVSVPNPGNLKYFQSFWVKVLAAVAANGYTVELLIPAEASTHSQVIPASDSRYAATGQPWYHAWLDWLIPPAAADDEAGFASSQPPAKRPRRDLAPPAVTAPVAAVNDPALDLPSAPGQRPAKRPRRSLAPSAVAVPVATVTDPDPTSDLPTTLGLVTPGDDDAGLAPGQYPDEHPRHDLAPVATVTDPTSALSTAPGLGTPGHDAPGQYPAERPRRDLAPPAAAVPVAAVTVPTRDLPTVPGLGTPGDEAGFAPGQHPAEPPRRGLAPPAATVPVAAVTDPTLDLLIAQGVATQDLDPVQAERAAHQTAIAEGREWYVRLLVDEPATGYQDHNSVLGQLLTARDGYDPQDLAELPPFGTPYLTLVFPHAEWGAQAGDYGSDFRAAVSPQRPQALPAMDWAFQIRSDRPGTQVILRWAGDPAMLKCSRLLDPSAGLTIDPTAAAYANGYPVTLTTGTRAFTWRFLGTPGPRRWTGGVNPATTPSLDHRY